jgi:hypothetical protein
MLNCEANRKTHGLHRQRHHQLICQITCQCKQDDSLPLLPHRTNTTSQIDKLITSCMQAVLTQFQCREYGCHSPGNWNRVLWQYNALCIQRKLLGCRCPLWGHITTAMECCLEFFRIKLCIIWLCKLKGKV